MKRLFLLQLMVLGLAGYGTAQTNPGLDPSFGDGNGYVITPGSETGSGYNDVVVQPDGKIVALGIGMARYNTDGSLDNSFGNAGINESIKGTAIIYLDDGKFLVRCVDGTIAKLNSNGSLLDNAFGNNGIITSNQVYIEAMALQPGGKIISAGSNSYWDSTWNSYKSCVIMERYFPNGAIDNSFGVNGIAKIWIPEENNEMSVDVSSAVIGIAIRSDGKIVIGGDYNVDSEHGRFAARFMDDGNIDTSFNHYGVAVNTQVTFTSAFALQPDGKVLLGGTEIFNPDDIAPYLLLRFNADGSLDSTFDSTGIAALNWEAGEENKVYNLSVQNDGKIIASGTAFSIPDNKYNFALIRCTPEGKVDSSFGMNGRVLIPIRSGEEGCSAIAFQSDGKILGVGSSLINDNATVYTRTLVRYLKDGNTSAINISGNKSLINIYPNPADKTLWIDNKSGNKIASIYIFDIIGKEIIQTKRTVIDVSMLKPGIYFSTIRLADNNIIHHSFIVHH